MVNPVEMGSHQFIRPRLKILVLVLIGALVVIIAGCTADGPRSREFDLTILDKTLNMDPPTIKVNIGDQVKLRVVADQDAELHLHGYDIKEVLVAGMAQEMMFVANATGKFNLVLHPKGDVKHQSSKESHQGDNHDHEEVVIGTVQVYPR